MQRDRKDERGEKLLQGETQRKDGRYEYKYRDRDGTRKSVYADTLKQLRIREYEICMKEGAKLLHDMSGVTLNDQFELWIPTKSNLRENTLQTYIVTYESYVKNGIGKRILNEITTTDLKVYYNSLLVNYRLSTSTIDHIQNIVFQVFQMAKESGGILSNPAERALKNMKRSYSKHTSIRKGMTQAQAVSFLNFLYENPKWRRWYSVFCVMLNTGLRVGELCGLRWKDVDMEKQYVDVNHSILYFKKGAEKSCNHICDVKTPESARIIPFDENTKKALKMEKKYQIENGIICKDVIDGETDFVFLNRFGKVFVQSQLNRALKRIVCDYNETQIRSKEDITLPHLTCHQLRHTFANVLCEKRVHPKVTQRLMGHSDIQSTMDIYTSVDNDVLFELYKEQINGKNEYFNKDTDCKKWKAGKGGGCAGSLEE